MSGYNRPTCSRPGCEKVVVGRKLCRAHYQAAWKAGEFVNAPLPPRVAGRTICPDEHKHAASSTCYIQHQCRCVPCKEAHAKMNARRNRQRAYGTFDRGVVDAEPVREHMMMLGEFGLGYKRVAVLAGLGITPVRNIIWGRQDSGPRYGEMQKHVKRATAEKILAVRPSIELLAAGVNIPARGVHRRVQALVTRGWSQSKLSERLGIDRGNFWRMMLADQVTVATHREVAALYEELWHQAPPHENHRDKIAYSRALKHANVRRWLPPLAWDDIDNDVEPPMPEDLVEIDDVAVDLALSGERVRLSILERREAVRRAHAERWSDNLTAERLHLAARTVLRIRQELGLDAFDFGDLQQVGA